MKAERAIGFELLLAEELVEGGFVGKARVAALVVEDVVVFVSLRDDLR
jgi:hypothetical protein